MKEIYEELSSILQERKTNQPKIEELDKQIKQYTDKVFKEYNNKMFGMDKNGLEYKVMERERQEVLAEQLKLDQEKKSLESVTLKRLASVKNNLENQIKQKEEELEKNENGYLKKAKEGLELLEKGYEEQIDPDVKEVMANNIEIYKTSVKNLEKRSVDIFKELRELRDINEKVSIKKLAELEDLVESKVELIQKETPEEELAKTGTTETKKKDEEQTKTEPAKEGTTETKKTKTGSAKTEPTKTESTIDKEESEADKIKREEELAWEEYEKNNGFEENKKKIEEQMKANSEKDPKATKKQVTQASDTKKSEQTKTEPAETKTEPAKTEPTKTESTIDKEESEADKIKSEEDLAWEEYEKNNGFEENKKKIEQEQIDKAWKEFEKENSEEERKQIVKEYREYRKSQSKGIWSIDITEATGNLLATDENGEVIFDENIFEYAERMKQNNPERFEFLENMDADIYQEFEKNYDERSMENVDPRVLFILLDKSSKDTAIEYCKSILEKEESIPFYLNYDLRDLYNNYVNSDLDEIKQVNNYAKTARKQNKATVKVTKDNIVKRAIGNIKMRYKEGRLLLPSPNSEVRAKQKETIKTKIEEMKEKLQQRSDRRQQRRNERKQKSADIDKNASLFDDRVEFGYDGYKDNAGAKPKSEKEVKTPHQKWSEQYQKDKNGNRYQSNEKVAQEAADSATKAQTNEKTNEPTDGQEAESEKQNDYDDYIYF